MAKLRATDIIAALLLSSSSVFAAPTQHGVTFLFPVPGLTLYYLDTVNVSYTSTFSSPSLLTFCSNGNNLSMKGEKNSHGLLAVDH